MGVYKCGIVETKTQIENYSSLLSHVYYSYFYQEDKKKEKKMNIAISQHDVNTPLSNHLFIIHYASNYALRIYQTVIC